MNGTRQKIQYSLALEPVDQGETPVSGYEGDLGRPQPERSFRSAALEGTAAGRACAGLARLQAEPLGSPLPDISGQENRGGSTGQTSKSTGAKAQCPGGEL